LAQVGQPSTPQGLSGAVACALGRYRRIIKRKRNTEPGDADHHRQPAYLSTTEDDDRHHRMQASAWWRRPGAGPQPRRLWRQPRLQLLRAGRPTGRSYAFRSTQASQGLPLKPRRGAQRTAWRGRAHAHGHHHSIVSAARGRLHGGLALQNSPADSDRSQPAAVSSHAEGFGQILLMHSQTQRAGQASRAAEPHTVKSPT
jgi:hypothetical protein